MNQAVEQLSTDLVELRIPSRAEWVALARLAVAAVANRLRFSIEDIEDIKLAVAEACTAVIQHERHGEELRHSPQHRRLHMEERGSNHAPMTGVFTRSARTRMPRRSNVSCA